MYFWHQVDIKWYYGQQQLIVIILRLIVYNSNNLTAYSLTIGAKVLA